MSPARVRRSEREDAVRVCRERGRRLGGPVRRFYLSETGSLVAETGVDKPGEADLLELPVFVEGLPGVEDETLRDLHVERTGELH